MWSCVRTWSPVLIVSVGGVSPHIIHLIPCTGTSYVHSSWSRGSPVSSQPTSGRGELNTAASTTPTAVLPAVRRPLDSVSTINHHGEGFIQQPAKIVVVLVRHCPDSCRISCDSVRPVVFGGAHTTHRGHVSNEGVYGGEGATSTSASSGKVTDCCD